MKDNKFDAVRFMRKIRDELSEKYAKDPESQDKDLEEVRKKIRAIQKPASTHRKKRVA
jgi:hypothetical protein